MNEPIVSIITINYNNLKGLTKTVESVKKQTTLQHIEYIVVDGGSKDGSVDYIEHNKSLFSTTISEKDKGIYDAMNKGLAIAKGEYVWFMNSGDCIHNANVVEQVLEVAKSNPDVIYGDTMFVDENGVEKGLMSKVTHKRLPSSLGPDSFKYGMNVCHQSFIARRAHTQPYNLVFKHVADIDWIIHTLKKTKTSVCIPIVIADFELGGHSVQNQKEGLRERFRVLMNHYGLTQTLFSHAAIALKSARFKMKK